MVIIRPISRIPILAARRIPPNPHSLRPVRAASNWSGSGPRYSHRSYLRWGTVFALSGIGIALVPNTMFASSPSDPSSQLETSPRATSTPNSLHSAPILNLIRSYLVYTACSFPRIIDVAPSMLYTFTHSPIPGLKTLTEFLVRHTFFAQFVPGETVEECIPKMEDMRTRNIGSMLNYSAEADVDASGGVVDHEANRAFEKKRLEEVYKALEAIADFEKGVGRRGGGVGSTGFALKITGLIDPDILARASTTLLRLRPTVQSNSPSSPRAAPHPSVPYPGTPLSADAQVVARENKDPRYLMSLKGAVPEMGVLESDQGLHEGDLEALGELWGKLKALGKFAKTKGVRLMIDAEHTWYQPALDAYTILLAQEYNKPARKGISSIESEGEAEFSGPLVFGTFQSYLNRQPEYLQAALKHAEENDYVLGVKLVRGAYFVQERKKWVDENRPGPDPIWADKAATDKAYNDSVRTVISTIASQLNSAHPERALNVVFGTHNPESCDLIVDSLKAEGLASKITEEGKLRLREDVQGKVYVAQLFGMKDDLTDKMAAAFEHSPMPFALKYIAYGQLAEVMPFLGRRAIENKAVMSGEGGADAERKRLSGELWRRVFG